MPIDDFFLGLSWKGVSIEETSILFKSRVKILECTQGKCIKKCLYNSVILQRTSN